MPSQSKKSMYPLTIFIMISFSLLSFGAMPLIVGHRGVAGHRPENTITSFQYALDLGIDIIEFDVHVCKSGELVVIHDDAVDRTTDGSGDVTTLTLEQLKTLKIEGYETIPTFIEVLDVINRKAVLAIELKNNGSAEPTAAIIKEYIQHKGWRPEDFYVISFNHQELLRFRQALPEIPLCAITEGYLEDHIAYAKNLGVEALGIPFQLISKEFLTTAQKEGFMVFVYTVNDPEDIDAMIQLSVDGIISDYPNRAVQVIANYHIPT